jgi:hypothetical protein
MHRTSTAVALALLLSVPASAGSLGGYPTEQVWSVALHMHASMSEQFGSMEWHSDKAAALGIDVIWWTDHDWRLSNYRHMKEYDFEATVWNPEKYRWEEPDAGGFGSNKVRAWLVSPSTTSPRARWRTRSPGEGRSVFVSRPWASPGPSGSTSTSTSGGRSCRVASRSRSG